MSKRKRETLKFYTLNELISSGHITKKSVNINTHDPLDEYDLDIYEYNSEDGSTSVVFSIREDMEAVLIKPKKYESVIIYLEDDPLTEERKEEIKISAEEMPIFKKSMDTLDRAKEKVEELNERFSCTNFRLRLDFYYNIPTDSVIYSYNFEIKDIILCLFEAETCVSSVVMSIGKYSEDSLEISSSTKDTHERNNLNKFLRAVAILIAPYIDPEIKYVDSFATNSTSAYLLVKYFGAVPSLQDSTEDENETMLQMLPSDLTQTTHEQMTNVIDEFEQITCTIELNETNLALAQNMFNETERRIVCERMPTVGGRRRIRRKTRKNKKRLGSKSVKRKNK